MNKYINKTSKVVSRIQGGLGNQLFCYAAARRLAFVNNAELVIDDVSGFARDYRYRRKYALDNFHIKARKATPGERLVPFERYRRAVMKWTARRKPFASRRYIEQDGFAYDQRLLSLQVKGPLYLDGLWQSEAYFKDIEQIIREDLQIIAPQDGQNQRMAEKIRATNSVTLHVRWFDAPDSNGLRNASVDYYQNAISLMETRTTSPHYFLFSDDHRAARERLSLPKGRASFVDYNKGDERAFADLWLMGQCRNFILSRSTFSWWGAWLSNNPRKLTIMPLFTPDDVLDWQSQGMLFENCIQI